MEISANYNSTNVTNPNKDKENNKLIVRPNFGLTTANRLSGGMSGVSASASVGVGGGPRLQAQVSQDTLQFGCGVDKVGTLLKGISLFYMTGFALGFCPGLALAATCAFLFSGRGQSFRHELCSALMSNNAAMAQLQATFNTQNQQQQVQVEAVNETKEAKEEQPNVVAEVQAREVPEIIVDVEDVQEVKDEKKEEKVLSPLERAQLKYAARNSLAINYPGEVCMIPKYAKAKENQEKLSLQVERREESERVAQEKLELAQARLDKAQAQYDKANAEVKAQMTDRMIKLQENVDKKDANARVAHERADLAKAQLAEATAKLAEAQRIFEDIQAEEMVEV